MRIIVSGSSGYVGSQLIQELQKYEFEVIGISRNSISDSKITNFNISNFYEGIKDFRPDVIINLAANVSKSFNKESITELIEANIKFPQLVATAAAESGCSKFINITTYSTFADNGSYSPETYYAATKKASEDLLEFFHQNTSMKILHLVFYDIYGPEQPHKRFLPDLVEAMKHSKEFHMSPGDQEINFLYIEDAVKGLISAATNQEFKWSKSALTYSLFSKHTVKLKKLPKLIAETLGYDPNKIVYDLPYRHNQIMNFSPRFEKLPNWEPEVSLRTGLLKSFSSQGKTN
jgi:nucleoside-diphosphate-sugar epimerase